MLPIVALELLKDIKLRQFMEKNALNYIYQDQYLDSIETISGEIKPSSLKLLSIALTHLKGIYFYDLMISLLF